MYWTGGRKRKEEKEEDKNDVEEKQQSRAFERGGRSNSLKESMRRK